MPRCGVGGVAGRQRGERQAAAMAATRVGAGTATVNSITHTATQDSPKPPAPYARRRSAS